SAQCIPLSTASTQLNFSYTTHPSRATLFFFFNDTATTEIYTLSLHDALPIYLPGAGLSRSALDARRASGLEVEARVAPRETDLRSEEHTSELQSRENLVCRLLLEKKKNKNIITKKEGYDNRNTKHETEIGSTA